MEEGEANRSGTQGSAACTHGESGPSCRHPSRRVHTHKRRCSAHSNKKQSSNKKGEIPAHHVDCLSTGSAANIHHKNNSFFFGRRSYSAHTTSFRPSHHRSSRTRKNISARNGIMQATIYLCFGLDIMRCLHALFCFFRGQTFMPGSCVGGFLQGTQLFFFPLVKFSCVGVANNSVCVVPASLR
ncbi:hypothetical protein TCDM_10184 [Trypanosoma cruzi Dm28c]|uniref:Uncharacterized protein n=1 Tax=Trypanosoma cruzi Dm28c TaxID=1416333 RepID=V5B845_TRYCR|nr:hypothetical protein TCDM_10184 [Trypanosoma cruzi Dm28c]